MGNEKIATIRKILVDTLDRLLSTVGESVLILRNALQNRRWILRNTISRRDIHGQLSGLIGCFATGLSQNRPTLELVPCEIPRYARPTSLNGIVKVCPTPKQKPLFARPAPRRSSMTKLT
jgi:hypothetical protein